MLANAYPVASLSVQGMTQRATLLDAVLITWTQGHELVALMTALAGFFLASGAIKFITVDIDLSMSRT